MTWAKAGAEFELYVELAANGMFGVGLGGDINPVDPDKYYELLQCELAVFHRDAWDLMWDFSVIAEMAKELPENDPRAAQALFVANSIQNAVWTDDRSTIARGRELAASFLSETNGPHCFTVSATGHAHIDTAWLWPYAETRRKVARSFASQLALMERYPIHKFSASQAQQYDWLKEDYPVLFGRVQEAARVGSFVPIGGTWVEMDCNLPSGESFCRQFLVGQRFFREHFGHYCNEFWLPDTFGYSAQLPQIIRGSGIKYFLTQKLSWNLINKFPHHTFHWEGLDGTSVLTHFPPADTYCSSVSVKDILYSVSNFKAEFLLCLCCRV
jgi:alpha-mannosidase